MDYKEKYEKAVQAAILAKQNTESAVTIGILEDIFPELAESEDEKIRRNIIAALKGEGYYDCDLTNECIAWLEKQGQVKESIISQHENKMYKENDDSLTSKDKKIYNAAINACKYMVDNFENSTKQYEDAIIWLKELYEQKPAWSEEDERRINHIIAFMSDKERIKDTETMFPIEEDIRWLKSLKERYTWKPSEV